MTLNPQASTSKGKQRHTWVEPNYSQLTTGQTLLKQSFVLPPEGTNIKQSWEQMQVLKIKLTL